MPSPVRVLIVGHSFVRRIDQFLSQKYIGFNHNFTLDRSLQHVKLVGKGGASVDDILPMFLANIDFSPQIVVIDIATNDLHSNTLPPHKLAQQVFNITKRLISRHGVQRVIVLEALPRTQFGLYGAPPSFNTKVAQYNTMIKNLVVQTGNAGLVCFWFHKGLPSQIHKFILDGCHFNQDGLLKYYRSIRRIIINTSSKVRGPQ